jgi:hypothetical protein
LWFVVLDKLGIWADGYRPTKIRVTLSDSISQLQLYDGDDPFGSPQILNVTTGYVSGTELTLSWAGGLDMSRIVLVSVSSFSVTNIEFFS